MINSNIKKTLLPTETKQKIGAVTYIVAAHFHEEQDDVATKIKHLLCTEIRKINNFAHLQNPK